MCIHVCWCQWHIAVYGYQANQIPCTLLASNQSKVHCRLNNIVVQSVASFWSVCSTVSLCSTPRTTQHNTNQPTNNLIWKPHPGPAWDSGWSFRIKGIPNDQRSSVHTVLLVHHRWPRFAWLRVADKNLWKDTNTLVEGHQRTIKIGYLTQCIACHSKSNVELCIPASHGTNHVAYLHQHHICLPLQVSENCWQENWTNLKIEKELNTSMPYFDKLVQNFYWNHTASLKLWIFPKLQMITALLI